MMPPVWPPPIMVTFLRAISPPWLCSYEVANDQGIEFVDPTKTGILCDEVSTRGPDSGRRYYGIRCAKCVLRPDQGSAFGSLLIESLRTEATRTVENRAIPICKCNCAVTERSHEYFGEDNHRQVGCKRAG